MIVPASTQFPSHNITRKSPVKSFVGYMAVWRHEEKHVLIVCPSLVQLREFWLELVDEPLIEDAVQHVDIIRADVQ